MNSYKFLFKTHIYFVLIIILGQLTYGQDQSLEEAHNKMDERIFGKDQNERNQKHSYTQSLKTIDSTHMFLGTDRFVSGNVVFKNKNYNTKLKYDILNDIVVIKNSDSLKNFSLNLNPELVEQFKINNLEMVKLNNNKNLKPYYKNGFFERKYQGKTFSFFIKHRKKLKKNSDRTNVLYSFWEEEIYLLEFKNRFYRIRGKHDIIKAAPHLKNQIKDFFGRYRKIDQTSLMRLFMQLDKISS